MTLEGRKLRFSRASILRLYLFGKEDRGGRRTVGLDTPNHDNITGQLCRYIAAGETAEFPTDVVWKAKQHILDTLAATVSGSRLKPGKLVTQFVQGQDGRRESQVVGSSIVTTATNAALANGVLAHSDETDDSHAASGTHPGCAVVPAALAMAEREGCDGQTFLKAVVLGYDVGCRVGRALVPHLLSSRGHSSRSICGTFGAAAAAACIARFDTIRVSTSLSYAAQQASGIGAYIRADDHVEKAFALGGMPARNGVTAVLLVQAGFTGGADAFQGERNFLQAYSSDPKPEELVRGLGTHYEVTETSIKRFCVGSPIQAPLEALMQLITEHGLKARDVKGLLVRLPEHRAHTVDDRSIPDINLQHVMSICLLDGHLTFEAAHSYERMTDPRVMEMKSRIKLQPEPELTHADFPRQAILEVLTLDGRHLRKHVMTYRGTPENPMTREEIESKVRDLVLPVIGNQRCDQLIKMIENLERVTDMREFRSLVAMGSHVF